MRFDYYRNTPIHKLDPRVKIFWLVSVTLASMLTLKPEALLIPFLYVLAMFLLAKPHKSPILRDKVVMTSLIMGVLMLIIFNGIFADIEKVENPEPLYIFGFKTPFLKERVYRGIGAALRLAITMLSFMLIIFTTPARDLSYAFDTLKIPPQLSLMASLAFRFIPTLYSEFYRLLAAMKARGQVKLEEGGVVDRIKAYRELLFALVVNSLATVRRLTIVLEARGFKERTSRTYVDEYKLSVIDGVILAISLAVITLTILLM